MFYFSLVDEITIDLGKFFLGSRLMSQILVFYLRRSFIHINKLLICKDLQIWCQDLHVLHLEPRQLRCNPASLFAKRVFIMLLADRMDILALRG